MIYKYEGKERANIDTSSLLYKNKNVQKMKCALSALTYCLNFLVLFSFFGIPLLDSKKAAAEMEVIITDFFSIKC